MNADPRQIHQQAEQAREKGNFLEALKLTDEALVVYQEAKDALGFAEVQASRFLILRHLFEKTTDKQYLILAKHAAMASVELAEKSGEEEALTLPYLNLAKAYETLEEIDQSIEYYKKAVESFQSNPPAQHNRPGVLADIRGHLATAELKMGDEPALERALQTLADLEASDEPDYNKHVWTSGAHMRIAEALKDSDSEKAKEHLQQAKKIIDSDDRLTLRLGQWEKLARTF